MKLRGSLLFMAVTMIAISIAAFPARVPAADQPQAATEIKIDNFTITPQAVTVPVGSQITWTNHDDIPHTVVSDDKTTFKSKALDTDNKFTFTFTKAGTYSYFCSIHPKMTAKVVVQ